MLGRSIQGRYRVDAMQNPMHLDIQVAMEGMPSDAPPVPYITKVRGGSVVFVLKTNTGATLDCSART